MFFQEFQTLVNRAVALSWDIWGVNIYYLISVAIADTDVWTELIVSVWGIFPDFRKIVVICLDFVKSFY